MSRMDQELQELKRFEPQAFGGTGASKTVRLLVFFLLVKIGHWSFEFSFANLFGSAIALAVMLGVAWLAGAIVEAIALGIWASTEEGQQRTAWEQQWAHWSYVTNLRQRALADWQNWTGRNSLPPGEWFMNRMAEIEAQDEADRRSNNQVAATLAAGAVVAHAVHVEGHRLHHDLTAGVNPTTAYVTRDQFNRQMRDKYGY